MGEKALRIFVEAELTGGFAAKTKLANRVRLTSIEAAVLPDSPELVDRLTQALAEVRRYDDPDDPELLDLLDDPPEAAGGLRRSLATLVEILGQCSLFIDDLEATARRVDEGTGRVLQCAQVSVWFFDDARTRITCTDLFVPSTGRHSSGLRLFAKDYPSYFAALATGQTIAAHDAHRDPATACFSDTYLMPLGITSMLDVPIVVGGEAVGVLCSEHTGPPRTWNSDEERFANGMAAVMALAVSRPKS